MTSLPGGRRPGGLARRGGAAGAVSIRLLLLGGLLAALAVPVMAGLWTMPALTTLPDASRAALWRVLLLQACAGVLVLGTAWTACVMRPVARLKSIAQGMAVDKASSAPANDIVGDMVGGELRELGSHLQQAQQRVIGLVGELEARHVLMRNMAMNDELTGLPNRRLFRELFDRAAALARRSNRPMALLFIDLDHFKAVNDRHGHPAGDELLLCVAGRLSETVRGSDLVGRLSGDEFIALLPDTAGFDPIAHTALRLIQAIEAPVPLSGGQGPGSVSASIGVARFPRDGADFDTLLHHADQAMYRAKTLGRGRYALFQPSLLTERDHPAGGADGELVHALDHGEMHLYFQPVIDTDSGQAVGAEGLLRWQHPSEGLLSPARFIRRAEECGQSHALSRTTLDQACGHLAQWKVMGLRPGRISINVSAPQFRHVDWVADLDRALSHHAIAPGELAVELTETVLMDDAESTQERIRALRTMGVPLVIDDFGSGLISLARLGDLKPAMLKLDPAFVQRLPEDASARAMVEGIVGLARSLAIAVVAEGVETTAQRDALAELGCHLQQGYLFARPQPALPEPAWPLPAWPGGSPLPVHGANDSGLGDLPALEPRLPPRASTSRRP